MTKAAYGRKGLFGLTVPEGQESVTIRGLEPWRQQQAWRLEQQAEGSHRQEVQRSNLAWLEALRPVPSDAFPPEPCHALSPIRDQVLNARYCGVLQNQCHLKTQNKTGFSPSH